MTIDDKYQKVSVVIMDNEKLMADCLSVALSQDYAVKSVADDLAVATHAVKVHKPDILISEFSYESGREAYEGFILNVRHISPKTKMLLLSTDERIVSDGGFSKNGSLESLLERLESVVGDDHPDCALVFLDSSPELYQKYASLGEITQKVFSHIMNGLSEKEVAKEMNRSYRTISYHTEAIRHAFGYPTMKKLVAELQEYFKSTRHTDDL